MAYDDDGDSVVTLFSNVESVVTVVEFLQPVEFGRVVDEVDPSIGGRKWSRAI